MFRISPSCHHHFLDTSCVIAARVKRLLFPFCAITSIHQLHFIHLLHCSTLLSDITSVAYIFPIIRPLTLHVVNSDFIRVYGTITQGPTPSVSSNQMKSLRSTCMCGVVTTGEMYATPHTSPVACVINVN